MFDDKQFFIANGCVKDEADYYAQMKAYKELMLCDKDLWIGNGWAKDEAEYDAQMETTFNSIMQEDALKQEAKDKNLEYRVEWGDISYCLDYEYIGSGDEDDSSNYTEYSYFMVWFKIKASNGATLGEGSYEFSGDLEWNKSVVLPESFNEFIDDMLDTARARVSQHIKSNR